MIGILVVANILLHLQYKMLAMVGIRCEVYGNSLYLLCNFLKSKNSPKKKIYSRKVNVPKMDLGEEIQKTQKENSKPELHSHASVSQESLLVVSGPIHVSVVICELGRPPAALGWTLVFSALPDYQLV